MRHWIDTFVITFVTYNIDAARSNPIFGLPATELLVDDTRHSWHRMEVVAINRLADGIYRLLIDAEEGSAPEFISGHYALLELSDGLARPLSIASAPGSKQMEFHVKHIPGSEFTTRLSRAMLVGDTVRVAAPLGNAYLRMDSPRPILLVAGGTGFAPAKAIIEHLSAISDPRPVRLFWGVRRMEEIYATDILNTLVGQHHDFAWLPVLSEPDINWCGAFGYPHEAALAVTSDLASYDIYLSGPPSMIPAAIDAMLAAGVCRDRLFYDNC